MCGWPTGRRGVPAWMFDPVICSGIRLEESPLIECGALNALALMLAQVREIARTGGMDFHNRNQRTARRVKHDGQLMPGLGCPHQPQRLSEPNRRQCNRRQCVTLLGRMLLCALNHKREPKTNIQP